MIRIDLSSMMPKQGGALLLGLIPGLLFELGLAFGDPEFAHQMLNRAAQVYAFPPYALVALFMVSCLVCGQALFLMAWIAYLIFEFSFGSTRYFHRFVSGSDWLYRLFGRLQGIPPKRNLFIRLLSRFVRWGREKRFPFVARPALRCQRMAATQLLARKYGITPGNGPYEWVDSEWDAWIPVLGTAPPWFRTQVLTSRTLFACGLAELAVIFLSPSLRNVYFYAITVPFLVAGCYPWLGFAKLRYDPMISTLARLHSILVELADVKPQTIESPNSPKKGGEVSLQVGPGEN
ncbi:MAG: hypothetical protein ABSC48_12920 [Terracidiphilus sp.]|jgi:hypothetical protein